MNNIIKSLNMENYSKIIRTMKNNIFKNLKFWLASGVLAGNLAKADDIFLNFSSPSNISINSTIQINEYSLQNKNSILDEQWTEIEKQRGTESNLVYNIDNTYSASFYKVDYGYQPIGPTNASIGFAHNPHQSQPTVTSAGIINYETNDIQVIINYEETMNPYGLGYTTDTPYQRILTPGANQVSASAFWNGSSGTGGSVYGNLLINRF